MDKNKSYSKGSVTSKDGTIIGYRQMGHGPGLILLHGGVNASQNLMKLGTLLRDEFTVYIPDRRGRGMSGPYGEDYSIRKEDEDLDAILKETGAHYVLERQMVRFLHCMQRFHYLPFTRLLLMNLLFFVVAWFG